MDLHYILIKCADGSDKGFNGLKKLQDLPNKFSLDEYIDKNDVGSCYDTPSSDEARERIGKYNDLKEKIMQQIAQFCLCTSYYEQESNNELSMHYYGCFLKAIDLAISSQYAALERIFEQSDTNYDTILATALAIRYGLDKGFLKVDD